MEKLGAAGQSVAYWKPFQSTGTGTGTGPGRMNRSKDRNLEAGRGGGGGGRAPHCNQVGPRSSRKS